MYWGTIATKLAYNRVPSAQYEHCLRAAGVHGIVSVGNHLVPVPDYSLNNASLYQCLQ